MRRRSAQREGMLGPLDDADTEHSLMMIRVQRVVKV